MKKVVFFCTAAVLALSLLSCNNDPKNEASASETELQDNKDLALGDAAENTSSYLYVTAPSGLSLREYGNLQSERLARMPYGTRVEVIEAETQPTMTVGGIKGGMHHIAYNHKKGFAFNGYLSRYFPPEPGISAEGYALELQALFPEVGYVESTGGSVSKPSNTVTLTLPGARWHEAFFAAQQLYDFPEEFAFPGMKGKDTETIDDTLPKEGTWTSQLQVTRADNTLQKITYVYTSATFNWNVEIKKDGNAMVLSKTEIIK
tara:strand:- start:8861 stop:9643 length:783 start_codon:yes stop_codon:yes gene_type:complete